MSAADASPPRWSPWSAPLALLLGVTLALVTTSVVFVVSDAVAGKGNTPAANIVGTILQDACFIAAALVLARAAGRTSLDQFGLRPTRLRPAIGWAALAYVSFIALAGLWLQLVDESAKDDNTLTDLGVDRSTIALVGAATVVCVFAPIAEEFLFRGFIFTALRNWRGPWAAAVLTGVLFGAIHLNPDRPVAFLLPLAFLGFLLCLVYWRTGSLYPCIALHAVNNAIAFGSTEGWDWQIPVLVVAALCAIAAILVPASRLGRRLVS